MMGLKVLPAVEPKKTQSSLTNQHKVLKTIRLFGRVGVDVAQEFQKTKAGAYRQLMPESGLFVTAQKLNFWTFNQTQPCTHGGRQVDLTFAADGGFKYQDVLHDVPQ